MWKMTYAAPFFGWDSLRQRIEYKGAVAVSMDIRLEDCLDPGLGLELKNKF